MIKSWEPCQGRPVSHMTLEEYLTTQSWRYETELACSMNSKEHGRCKRLNSYRNTTAVSSISSTPSSTSAGGGGGGEYIRRIQKRLVPREQTSECKNVWSWKNARNTLSGDFFWTFNHWTNSAFLHGPHQRPGLCRIASKKYLIHRTWVPDTKLLNISKDSITNRPCHVQWCCRIPTILRTFMPPFQGSTPLRIIGITTKKTMTWIFIAIKINYKFWFESWILKRILKYAIMRKAKWQGIQNHKWKFKGITITSQRLEALITTWHFHYLM